MPICEDMTELCRVQRGMCEDRRGMREDQRNKRKAMMEECEGVNEFREEMSAGSSKCVDW